MVLPESMSEIILGLGFAVMAGVTILFLLRPLSRTRPEPAREMPHVSFYRDQLEEVDRDLARGVLARDEVEISRTEIARRLLAAEDQSRSELSSPALRKLTALGILLTAPLLALALYLAQGSPELPDEPFAPRVEGALDELPIEALVFRVSQQLKETPDDLKGWEVIAPIYSDLGRFSEAANAWQRAIAIGGPTASRLASLGEARMRVGGKGMGKEERQIFGEAEKLDPMEPRAQYYLGLAEIEDGKRAEAAGRWQRLLDKGGAEEPWRAGLEAALLQLNASPAAEAIAALPAADQTAAIESMVAGLAAKLEKTPQDIEGWLRLIKSYGVLNKPDEAKAALLRARKEFAADKAALARLDAAEKAQN
jgi:cytochrome c-type biogenesis protein CcmH